MLVPSSEHRIPRLVKPLWVVAGKVQAAALVAFQGAADDQVGGHHEVPEFDQVMADPEVRVVFVDFLFQQTDAMLGTLQTLGRAHDADVIPHEAAQFFPVVRNHDFLVGVRHPAFVPLGQFAPLLSRLGEDVGGRGFRID